MYHNNNVIQRKTAVTAYLSSKQLLLLAIEHAGWHVACRPYLNSLSEIFYLALFAGLKEVVAN